MAWVLFFPRVNSRARNWSDWKPLALSSRHRLDVLVGDHARSSWTRLVEQSIDPFLDKASPPLDHRLWRDPLALGDLFVGEALGTQQDDACPLGQGLARLAAGRPPPQRGPILFRQHQGSERTTQGGIDAAPALSGNQLSGPIPPELGELKNLRSLNLDSNQLSGPIPAALGNLASLQSLWLSQGAGPRPNDEAPPTQRVKQGNRLVPSMGLGRLEPEAAPAAGDD